VRVCGALQANELGGITIVCAWVSLTKFLTVPLLVQGVGAAGVLCSAVCHELGAARPEWFVPKYAGEI